MSNTLTCRMVIICMAAATLIALSCGETGEQESGGLPGIPDDLRNELVATCDYVDIIFYNSPASMNQTDQGSIQRALGFISPQPAKLNKSCQPLGRISYMSDGVITAEGDIYLSEGCQYIVFIQDNREVYANTMSPEGVQFFGQIIQGIQNQMPQQ